MAEINEYMEPCCCFDASRYTGVPDAAHIENPLNVPEIIAGLDELNNTGRESEGAAYLENWLDKARERRDWRAEISVLSELLGQYRRTDDREKGIRCINRTLDLLREHRLGSTVSGATVLLNAATTMKCFGMAKESVPVFTHVARIYAGELDPHDYRFPGLYNNMALSYADTGEYSTAERYFRLACALLEKLPHTENDLAVTMCNMAEMYYAQDAEDPRVEECMDKAWELLSSPELAHDGYHAFTISKCIPTFDLFGYFLYSAELKKRAEEIYKAR